MLKIIAVALVGLITAFGYAIIVLSHSIGKDDNENRKKRMF